MSDAQGKGRGLVRSVWSGLLTHVVSHEQVVGVRRVSTNAEQLGQVMLQSRNKQVAAGVGRASRQRSHTAWDLVSS